MRAAHLALVLVAVFGGAAAGLGGYTFFYAQGTSYLTDDPSACANCHIMRQQHEGWARSSHRAVAVCNDCHTPPGLIPKYVTKASNGFWHSFGFTTGWFHDPIRIKPHNREIVEDSCRQCHQQIVFAIEAPHGGDERLSCTRCHSSVGHVEGMIVRRSPQLEEGDARHGQ